MIALKAVLHHKQVNSYESTVIWSISIVRLILIHIGNLRLADFVGILHFLHEGGIRVVAVALFEDDGADLRQWLLNTLGLNLQLRRVEIYDSGMSTRIFSLSCAFLERLSFDPCQVLMGLTYVLVGISWQRGEVWSRNDFAEDRLRPLLARLVLILDL